MTTTLEETAKPSIPDYLAELDSITSILTETLSLGVILIDTSSLERVERVHGRKVYQDVLETVAGIILDMQGEIIRKGDVLAVNRRGGDQFLVFLNKKRNDRSFHTTDLESLAGRVSKAVNARVFEKAFPYVKGRPDITVGHAIVIQNPLIGEAALIERVIEDARTMSRFQRIRSEIRDKEKLQEIIIKEQIHILFQPIAELDTGKIIGFEALSRGPEGTEYENPYFLFDTAREVGLLFELDRICRKKALVQAALLDPEKHVFINCMPTTIHDPEFRGSYLEELLVDVQRSPQNIVMEVSEREAIDDYAAFRAALAHYADLGFSIAIDDTGAGYSSLEAIVELEPDYLKLDISMVRNIQEHMLKQELIRAIVTFSSKIGATIIAEGIETEEERETLRKLGVPLGQGFLLGRPAAP